MESESATDAKRPFVWLPLSLALAGGVFALDYFTGSEISVSFFYLVPVTLATWLVGRRAGTLVSILCAAGWATAYFMDGRFYSQPHIIYWNTAVEVAMFLTVTFALSAVRAGYEKEQALQRRLETAYQQLDGEMRVVGDIQRGLLPAAPPALPGLRIAVHYATSAHAGGDYYDFFPLRGGDIGVLIADVSGHGTPAAVVMTMMRVLLHTAPGSIEQPEAVLAVLNRQLQEQTLHGQFVTACYATLGGRDGRIQYAMAGHNPPLVIRGASGAIEEFDMDGPPLGIFAGPEYHRCCARLAPGDSLLFYTDGLTEAMNPAGEMLGLERVQEVLVAHRAEPPEALRDHLLAELRRHGAGRPASDDVTLILLRAA
jgi:sigma-B regulation protein RsbU (phosphoserine phosphatase)